MAIDPKKERNYLTIGMLSWTLAPVIGAVLGGIFGPKTGADYTTLFNVSAGAATGLGYTLSGKAISKGLSYFLDQQSDKLKAEVKSVAAIQNSSRPKATLKLDGLIIKFGIGLAVSLGIQFAYAAGYAYKSPQIFSTIRDEAVTLTDLKINQP